MNQIKLDFSEPQATTRDQVRRVLVQWVPARDGFVIDFMLDGRTFSATVGFAKELQRQLGAVLGSMED